MLYSLCHIFTGMLIIFTMLLTAYPAHFNPSHPLRAKSPLPYRVIFPVVYSCLALLKKHSTSLCAPPSYSWTNECIVYFHVYRLYSLLPSNKFGDAIPTVHGFSDCLFSIRLIVCCEVRGIPLQVNSWYEEGLRLSIFFPLRSGRYGKNYPTGCEVT